tara:strand:+ start:266 stop:553 length:288 start_codon:yes stop_codon:yes gene_type:complete
MNPRDIILEYSLTEKATDQASFNKYTFVVSKDATRTQVHQAVEQHFGDVEVGKVNILVRKGKGKSNRMRGMRGGGRTATTKRAIVTLAKGKIDLV